MMRHVFPCLLILLIVASGCVSTQAVKLDTPIGRTGIAGQVSDQDGLPVAGAWVYAYRNTNTSLRGPADFGVRTDKAGHYFLDMVAGPYYLIARWRKDGGEAGPPRAGDAWAMPEKNPIQVEQSQVSRCSFRLQGVRLGQPVLLRQGSISQGKTGFTGRLVDAEGKAMAGAFALAYADLDFRRMPDYTSAVVGSSGRFFLYVPENGRYCLAARTRTRGQPIYGEPYGLLGEGESACLSTVEDQLIDIGHIRLTPYQR